MKHISDGALKHWKLVLTALGTIIALITFLDGRYSPSSLSGAVASEVSQRQQDTSAMRGEVHEIHEDVRDIHADVRAIRNHELGKD